MLMETLEQGPSAMHIHNKMLNLGISVYYNENMMKTITLELFYNDRYQLNEFIWYRGV